MVATVVAKGTKDADDGEASGDEGSGWYRNSNNEMTVMFYFSVSHAF